MNISTYCNGITRSGWGGGLVEADDFYASYYVNVIEDLKREPGEI